MYHPKGGDDLRWGVMAGMAYVLPYLRALENAIIFKGALQISAGLLYLIYTYYFNFKARLYVRYISLELV